MELFGIGEIARKAGVATSTIRYYERIGLLPPCKRVSGKRRYDTTIFHKLALIRLAQGAGLTIAEIQTLMHGFPADASPSERWQTLAPRKLEEVETLINQALAMKRILEQSLECRCTSLEDCAGIERYADSSNHSLNC